MKVILFGATGMVGQGVLRECVLDRQVEEVLTVVRAPTGVQHEKVRERVHQFLQSALDALAANRSGLNFTATDDKGNTKTFVESQVVAELLKYFRALTQVVIGEAVAVPELRAFLKENKIPVPE